MHRTYIKNEGNGTFTLDPRYLCFEYSVNFMLRPRQVELVGEFMRAAMTGRSRVEQVVHCRCLVRGCADDYGCW